jgi:transketolase
MTAKNGAGTPFGALDERSINVMRGLAMDAVEAANSGHPGLPMGAAAMTYVLWTRHLRHSPANPHWPDRDRFVLSAGHGSMLLYALLHLTGYDLPIAELKNFRQRHSRTPGHPEYGHTPGVETTTGPLGQGFSNAVGMALAERWLAGTFNREDQKVVDHWTYVLASDGDLMEGVSSEAASLAGHLGLGRLVVLYDSNKISIDGSTDLAFTEDVGARFAAYGWHVQHVDGNALNEVDSALTTARSVEDRPSLIVARTQIGFGSPNKAGSAASHGAPLGAPEVLLCKECFGLPGDQTFWVPEDVRDHMRAAVARGRQAEKEWSARVRAHASSYAEQAAGFAAALDGDMSAAPGALPVFQAGTSISTRKASGQTLNALAKAIPSLLGGSADLAESNQTELKGLGAIQRNNYTGRNIHFGVREHAMGSMCNGMLLHGGIRVFAGTFLIFSDYMRPAIRLAALMGVPAIYVFTHDSIGLGEDGPTHQPIEQLMSLRLIPGLHVIRPADANETAVAWRVALESRHNPVALLLTRQNLPVFDRARDGVADASELARGGYVLSEAMRDGEAVTPDVILIASGSEVHPCMAAQELLEADGIAARVVSMPATSLFDAQPEAYRDSVLPPLISARVSVEAGSRRGWETYTGNSGESIGLDHFGASAPAELLFKEWGFTPENIAARARVVVERSLLVDAAQ